MADQAHTKLVEAVMGMALLFVVALAGVLVVFLRRKHKSQKRDRDGGDVPLNDIPVNVFVTSLQFTKNNNPMLVFIASERPLSKWARSPLPLIRRRYLVQP